MAKVKYRVRERIPSDNQFGTHSFYAECVINVDITAVELARKIAARTGMKSYEAQAGHHGCGTCPQDCCPHRHEIV